LAGGINQYGYGDGDPVNNSDPFGLTPALACAMAMPVCIQVTVSTGALVAGAAIAGATAIGNVLSGRHAAAVDRTVTSLDIAGSHIVDAATGPPNGDDDRNWVKDKLDDAQKHINNARKYVQKAVGRTRRDLEQQIDRAQQQVDRLRAAERTPEP
jgi:hypothetical protein